MPTRRSRRTNGAPHAARQRLSRRARELRDEGAALADSVRGAAGDLAEISRAQLEHSPYLTLGAAFALGWVLGGGLPLRLAVAAARLGAWAAFDSVVSQTLRDGAHPDEG